MRLLWLVITFSLILYTHQQSRKSQQIFRPSWLNYIKNNNNDQQFIVSNPTSTFQVHFQINNSNKIRTKQISISQQNIWKSIYEKQNDFKFTIHSKGKEGVIEIDLNKNKKIHFIIKRADSKKSSFIYISTSDSQKESFKPIQQQCGTIQKQNYQIICNFQQTQKIILIFSQTQQFVSVLSLAQDNDKFRLSLQNFIKRQKIQQIQNFTTEFVQQMITNTLSSICYEQSQYKGFGFYGLCSNNNKKQIQRHYSLLVLDILFGYNKNLSMWLIQNYLNLLQQKLFYSFRQNQWIPIPEHTQAFKTYLKNFYINKNNLTVQEMQKRKNLVIQVQNGLINNLLLSQVNHLSQQINYRQSKTIHPTLLKMLTQSWKSSSSRARISSIYSQSFTADFYYHGKNQKLDSSVSKMSWLLKLVYEHIDTIQKQGDIIQKQSLEQLLSLSRVISGYMLDQPKAKQGMFSSIIIQQKIKVYSRSVGYQSLLPFTYDITQAFPLVPVYNLTTQYGIASFPVKNQHADQRYDYRGNINLYFNYKILFTILHKGVDKPKIKPFTEGAVFVIQAVQKFIQNTYEKSKGNLQIQNFATSWTFQGKIKKSQKYLAILNTVFMNDIKPFKSTQNKKEKEKEKINQKQKDNIGLKQK